MDRAIRAPDLLAGVLVKGGDELFLLVVIDDDQKIAQQGG